MKKIRFLALLLALLCLLPGLAACSKKPKNLDKVIGSANGEPPLKLTSSKQLEVDGILTQSSPYFSLFVGTDETGETVTRVYSHCANQVIQTLKTNTQQTQYVAFQNASGSAVLLVLTLQNEIDISSNPLSNILSVVPSEYSEIFNKPIPTRYDQMELSVYDPYGTLLLTETDLNTNDDVSTNYSPIDTYCKTNLKFIASETLFHCKNTLYRVEENASLSKIKTFDLQKIPNITALHSKYYYDISSSQIAVYDQDLNRVMLYQQPVYENMRSNVWVLDSGNLFVQYLIALPFDAQKYDLYDNNVKYAMTSLIVSAKNGSAKEIDANYWISDLTAVSVEVAKDPNQANYYQKDVENIAAIRYITKEKQLDTSSASLEIVLFSNKGSVGRSIKVIPEMADIPTIAGDDVYMTYSPDEGYTIFEGDGTILLNYGTSHTKIGNYVIGTDAIYNLKGKSVYNLQKNNARILKTFSESAIIVTEKDDVETAYLFVDGKATEIGIISGEGKMFYFNYSDHFYCLKKDSGQYEYYNSYGEKFAALDWGFEKVYGQNYNGVLISNGTNYCQFLFDHAD